MLVRSIKANMNYLEAKTVLSKTPPPIPLRMIAVEAVIMISAAGVLVRLFA